MGVTVGDETIIGAGSVVTKDVPTRSVVAGNPAKVLMGLDEWLAERCADPAVIRDVEVPSIPVSDEAHARSRAAFE